MKYLVLALAGSALMASPAFAQATQTPTTSGAAASSAADVKVGASVVDGPGCQPA